VAISEWPSLKIYKRTLELVIRLRHGYTSRVGGPMGGATPQTTSVVWLPNSSTGKTVCDQLQLDGAALLTVVVSAEPEQQSGASTPLCTYAER